MPRDENPIYDPDGTRSKNKQDGKIWFLAGTTEHIDGRALRKCQIPKMRSILVPLMNVILVKDNDLHTIKKLKEMGNNTVASITDLDLSINNNTISNLKQYRVQSQPFKVKVNKTNFLSLREGIHLAISDGYWIIFDKPEVGNYNIHFSGSSRMTGHEFHQDITYLITIN